MIVADLTDERGGLPSASAAPRWVPCTASFQLERTFKARDKTTQSKNRGTKIHKSLEVSQLRNLNHSDAICAERIMYHEGRLVDKYNMEGAAIIREQRYWVMADEEKVFSARIDSIHLTKKLALVINYKTGFYPQEKIDLDWQCAAEAVCVWQNLNCDAVLVAKIHPNTHPGYQARMCDEETLERLAERLESSALEAVSDTPKFKPGPMQCQWCLGKKLGICMAYLEWRNSNDGIR